jgi:hypothetical protein
VPPAGSQPPCGSGQSLNPYPAHYRLAFASSRLFYLHHTSAFLTVGLLGAFAPRVIQAYHVPQAVPANGLRVPLYTGEDSACVRRPLTSPELASCPLLGLEPLSRLSSAGVTMRNTEASLTVPLPIFPRSRSTVRLGFSTPAVCLSPHHYQGRPHRAETEGTTS